MDPIIILLIVLLCLAITIIFFVLAVKNKSEEHWSEYEEILSDRIFEQNEIITKLNEQIKEHQLTILNLKDEIDRYKLKEIDEENGKH